MDIINRRRKGGMIQDASKQEKIKGNTQVR